MVHIGINNDDEGNGESKTGGTPPPPINKYSMPPGWFALILFCQFFLQSLLVAMVPILGFQFELERGVDGGYDNAVVDGGDDRLCLGCMCWDVGTLVMVVVCVSMEEYSQTRMALIINACQLQMSLYIFTQTPVSYHKIARTINSRFFFLKNSQNTDSVRVL